MLTVRENARLQSFDDTFILLGPRSTGGGGAGNKKRLVEVPQYSQIGNAIPPLMAKAIGETLLSALSSEQQKQHVLFHTNIQFGRE
jgi:DNA (cytosine-5)-methyltransferase 1